MKLEERITYISYIIVGAIFIFIGIALDELALLERVNEFGFDQYYQFLRPWVGNFEGTGLPVPWDGGS